ncbi:DNA-binding protein [Aaosphaeria arxii CBS 175.79]|uniref:DNA-binding protein n=1 Tax=Aaosphaeria arxii CBS 175.79 TaxID=1450172 RepID=A0A6A5Y1N8_9PLEO|nr:DNA-binding protein [Aaosphaeria arxii CBS 175.79]KAF2018740.1 DNA-binding protein [Aaosphaeria arxii CBS 175.79]
MTSQTYTTTLTHFTNFLTCYIHTLLYLRALYPPATFAPSRFHNTSVHQSRHPAVCTWIADAVSAVHSELLAGTVARIAIVIYHLSPPPPSPPGGSNSPQGKTTAAPQGSPKILERFLLDVSRFPVISPRERDREIDLARDPLSPSSPGVSLSNPSSSNDAPPKASATPLDKDVEANLSEQYRAALISLHTRCARLGPLPKGCGFNVSMELRDDAEVDPPIGGRAGAEQGVWIPAQESLQRTGRKGAAGSGTGTGTGTGESEVVGEGEGGDLGGVRVTPIRTVQAGVFKFETWVEEGRAKFEGGDK